VSQRTLIEIIQAVIACVLIAIEAYLLVSGKPADGFETAVPIVLAFYFGRQVGNGVASLSNRSAGASPPSSGDEPSA
jgi:hypothetical protein